MDRVRLIHWAPAAAAERGDEFRSLGFEVVDEPLNPEGVLALR